MSPCTRVLLCLFSAQLLVPASAVLSFDIDLDAPPEERWVEVATHYKTEMVAMAKAVEPMMLPRAPWAWLKTVKFGPEYEAEMNGMVKAVNDPACGLDQVKLMNLLYEMQSPTACSGVLWALPNGTVMQGRQMDYGLHFEMPDGKIMNWPNVTFHAVFRKGGQRLFQSTHWPFGIGVHTGMRYKDASGHGWSFQQNTRYKQNDWHRNLAAAKQGGELWALVSRKAMETIPNFKDAVELMSTSEYMAPSYFIMAGTGPFEGAAITTDRMGEHSVHTPPIQTVSNEGSGWHLVQTNDDMTNDFEEVEDGRFPIANFMLGAATQEIVSPDHLMQFLHTRPLWWEVTVFSTVMVPGFDYYKTNLHDEGHSINAELFTEDSPVVLPRKFMSQLGEGNTIPQWFFVNPAKEVLLQRHGFLAARS